jgi:5-hydroxyisourate hydrolase-like protein (transthyretin family)
MKRKVNSLIVIILLIFSTFVVLPTQGEKTDINPNENHMSQLTDKFGDGKTEYWGLFVGVGKYAEDWEIPEMFETAEKLKDELVKSPSWSEDHIKVITGKNATFKNIIKGLRWLDSMEDADDISLLHFNTHGSSIPFDVPPRDEADGKDEILVTYYGLALPYTNILDDTLNLYLGRLESKGTAVIIDCCNAGGFNDPPWFKKLERSKSVYPRVKSNQATYEWMENFGRELRQSGRVIIMCCEEDEYGYAGTYSPYMLDAFRGFGDTNHDNIITAEEVHNYTKLRALKFLQNPTIYDDYEGELPLLEISESPIEPIKTSKENEILEKEFFEKSDNPFDKINFSVDGKKFVDPLLPENSVVCGYIIDNKTKDPLQNVNVSLYCQYEEGYYNFNYTSSNNQGFYNFNTTSGKIALILSLKKYYTEIIYWLDIDENETLWKNVSMKSADETSTVCGYIRDNITNEPIQNANISLIWYNFSYNNYYNYTLSDSSGFYSINVPKGRIELDIYAEGYLEQEWPEYSSYNMSEGETIWLNITLFPRPPQNSIVKGYITDQKTEEPIQDARVRLYWRDNQGHHEYNYTYTDSLGFYQINVAKGSIKLRFSKKDYFSDYSDYYDISENETKWINFSLFPRPPENSIVKGYVTDFETEEPMQGVEVEIDWEDSYGNYDFNYTYTDSQGFYSMNVAEGIIKLYFYENGYYSNYWPEYGNYNISANETIWVNLSLKPHPPENSILKGYITDSETEEPIYNASIYVTWRDDEGHYDNNRTFTDSFGFYSMNVANGSIRVDINAYNYSHRPIDWFDIGENEIVWLNVSLNSYDYTVHGYITNRNDDSPVENASIGFYCMDQYGNYYYKGASSDKSGFYSVKLLKGFISEISVRADGFFKFYSNDEIPLDNYHELWINISIIPYPPETAKVYGYIKNIETNEPIYNATIDLVWYEDYQYEHYYENTTSSDENGFYSFNVAGGIIEFRVSADSYRNYYLRDFEIDDYEIIWINMSLEPLPIQNAVVCGFIRDVETNQPLQGVEVDIVWEDFDDEYYDYNYSFTDDNGFFSMNVAEGIIVVYGLMDGYLDEYTRRLKIYENEVLWINLSMYPEPPRNSFVCGYIRDAETGEPLRNANVHIRWIGCEWHHDSFIMGQDTGIDGYYSINVPAGELYLEPNCKNYHWQYFDRQDIGENETLWFNFSLEKMKVDVEIFKPASAIYIKNRIMFPYAKPLIFGIIQIVIDVSYCKELESLELYIDDDLRLEIKDEPNFGLYQYMWTREKISIFNHDHTIKVIAVDIDGNTDIEEIEVTRYL